MKTTLNKIREDDPDTYFLEKLLSHLGKTQADDDPIRILTVLNSIGFIEALRCFRAVGGYEKELRMYAVWCIRQIQYLMNDPPSIVALDVAERHAKGEATDEELAAAFELAEDVSFLLARDDAWSGALRSAGYAIGCAVQDAEARVAWPKEWSKAQDKAREKVKDSARYWAKYEIEAKLRGLLEEIEEREAKMKTKCGEVCGSHGCTNSEGCPISTRESVEKDMGVWKAAKIGKRYHAAPAYAPSHWPKTLKAWAWAVLIVTLLSMLAGFVVGVLA